LPKIPSLNQLVAASNTYIPRYQDDVAHFTIAYMAISSAITVGIPLPLLYRPSFLLLGAIVFSLCMFLMAETL
jgi:hypothetical protein